MFYRHDLRFPSLLIVLIGMDLSNAPLGGVNEKPEYVETHFSCYR